MSFLINPFLGAASDIINSGGVVGGEITFTGLDLSSYYEVRVYYSGIKVDTDGVDVGLQLEIDGALVTSSSYLTCAATRASAGGGGSGGSAATSVISLNETGASFGVGNAANESLSGYFSLGNPVSSKNKYIYNNSSWRIPSGEASYGYSGGLLLNTGNVTGFKILCSGGGTLTAGRAFILGLS